MNKVVQMTKRDRADLFAETAERRGLSDAVVEKDFWVCWALKQLFAIDALRDLRHLCGEAVPRVVESY